MRDPVLTTDFTRELLSVKPVIIDKQRLRDSKDIAVTFVLALSILAAIGHFIDFLEEKSPNQLELAGAFLLIALLCAVAASNRRVILSAALFGIALIGIVGAVVHRTLWGLFIVIPAALIGALVLIGSSRRKPG